MSVRMELSRVLILDSSPEQFITLSEVGGPRSFAIKIGTAEAVAIERRWRGAEPPRPQTHELLDSVVRSLGARLEGIEIHDLRQGTYFANLVLRASDGSTVEVDARPSDAIALAIAHDAPILVEEAVVASSAEERDEIEPPFESAEEDDE
jgi:uncharacterized protein